jgi:transposase
LGLKAAPALQRRKSKLGSISKQGDHQLRTLLVVGASSIIKQAKRGVSLPVWLTGMMPRKPTNLVAVALASKTARIIWTSLANEGFYRKPQMAEAVA